MATKIAGPAGSIARGGPMATIPVQYIPVDNMASAADGGAGFGTFLESLGSGAKKLRESLGPGAEKLRARLQKAGNVGGKGAALRGTALGGGMTLAGRYLPLAGGAVQALSGDPLGGVSSAAGGILGAAVGAPLGPLGVLGFSALGSSLAQGAARNIQNLAGNLIGGAKAAQREAGRSPGMFGLTGEQIAALSPEDQERLIRAAGAGALEEAYPTVRAMRDNELQRQMQLNQQVGQLTGALNQQRYLAQLTARGMGEAGATTRSMINAPNPYAASAFQYNAPGSL